MKKFIFIFYLFLAPCFAAGDFYQFKNPEQQQQFNFLTNELRCLVCQNQNIAESNAGLAADLRGEIYQKIQQGESNTAIIEYLVTRYGNFILYDPPMDRQTMGLWLTPFLLLLIGLSYLLYYIYRNQKAKKL